MHFPSLRLFGGSQQTMTECNVHQDLSLKGGTFLLTRSTIGHQNNLSSHDLMKERASTQCLRAKVEQSFQPIDQISFTFPRSQSADNIWEIKI